MWIDPKQKKNQKIVLREKEEDNISIPTDPNSFLHATNLGGGLGLAMGFYFTDIFRFVIILYFVWSDSFSEQVCHWITNLKLNITPK